MTDEEQQRLRIQKINDYFLFYSVMSDRYDTEDNQYYAKKSRVMKMRLDKIVEEYNDRY